MDIKATTTVTMTVVMYYICYIPTVVLSAWLRNEEHKVADPWSIFMTAFASFLSGASNPVIYVIRNRRYRSAIGQFLKDPCGENPYRDNAIRDENKGKQPELKPQNEGEQCKDARGPVANQNPGRDPRRPPSAKIQIHQSHGVMKMAWEKQEDSGNLPGPADEQVAVGGASRRGGEKVQEEKGECSGLVRDRGKKVKSAGGQRIGTFAGGKVQPL